MDDNTFELVASIVLYSIRLKSGTLLYSMRSIMDIEFVSPAWRAKPDRLCWKNTATTSMMTMAQRAIRS